MEIWKTFGDLMKNLQLNFKSIDDKLAKQIVQFMSAKAESLEILYLENCNGNILNEFASPILSVTVLKWLTKAESSSETVEIKKLTDIFPNVILLILKNIKSSDLVLIDGKFANLMVLRMELPKIVDEMLIVSFLQNNPTVQTLEIQYASFDLLKQINQILPNLEVLTLESLPKNYAVFKSDPIRFDQVKKLTIDVKFHELNAPENIIFNQLEELTLNIRSKFTDKWIKFINNNVNSNLKSLKLTNAHLKKEQLHAILDHFNNIQTLDITCQSKFEALDIIDFEEKNKNAHIIQMKFDMKISEIGFISILMKVFLDDWNVQVTPEFEIAENVYRCKMELW